MANRVEIVGYQESQFAELLLFLKKWEPNHPELADGSILRWQKCHQFVATYNSRIVGYIGQIPHDFSYGRFSGRFGIEHFGWGVTLVLDLSDSRIRKEAGRGLLSRVENNSPLLFAGVGVVPAIEEPYKRRGHQVRRDCCNMYARFENPAKALRYLSKPAYYAPLIKIANQFRRVWVGADEDLIEGVKWIDRFSLFHDDTWERILYGQYELYGTRTAEYLNYKLSQPNREYYVFQHVSDGYIILRTAKHPLKDLAIVKICDLVGSDRVRRQLLRLAMKYLYHEKADGIVALGSALDKKLYRSVGMYISKAYPICLHKSIETKVHVSFFDSDLDNLW